MASCWAAANGGVTNGGLRGVWPPFPEIGWNRPFSPFFCLFRPFPEGAKSTLKIRKTEEKAFFLRYPRISLNPHLLNPHLRHSNLDFELRTALCRRNLWIFPPHVHVNLAVDLAVDSVMDFSWSFEPSKTGYNGPEKFAPKFAQEFALTFTPPRGKIRTGFALQDARANFEGHTDGEGAPSRIDWNLLLTAAASRGDRPSMTPLVATCLQVSLAAEGLRVLISAWVHQNRASPFASDFYRRRGYRKEFRNEDHILPFFIAEKIAVR